MNRLPEGPGARRRDVMELLAASRRASLEGPPRGAASARAAAIAARPTGQGRANRGPYARGVMKRAMVTAGVAFTAVGAAVAVLVSAAPGTPPRAARGATAPRAHARTARPMTAREILLAAAAHVAGGPVTGKYWRVTMIGGVTIPGGTKSDPYDISLRTYADQWNPSSPGQQEWVISQQLGTRPASPADAAGWRAAGSPATWHSGRRPDGYLAGYPLE